jgi:hypothetical protein
MKKNANILNLLLSATMLLLLFGCKKGLIESQADPSLSTSKKGSPLSILSVPDVYVAGSDGGQATYWKNGTPVTLPGGTQANGIFVDGTDVYVCGYGSDPVTFNSVAMYWKNGVQTILSDGTNLVIATGITVSGGDVYVSGRVGFFGTIGVYWHNGVEVSLGTGDPNGIFAAPNGDIYIANGQWGNPSYWLNGSLVTLTGPSNAYVRAVATNGTDVFVVGTSSSGPNETALYWKNGVQQSLMSPSKTSAMAVAVNAAGNAVISGTSGTSVTNMQVSYWDPVGDLSPVTSGRFVAAGTGIAVDPVTDDIYVCGSEYNTTTPPARAKYWVISGGSVISTVDLSSGPANATALAIALGW